MMVDQFTEQGMLKNEEPLTDAKIVEALNETNGDLEAAMEKLFGPMAGGDDYDDEDDKQ
jgi:hypothetical protein